MSRTLQFTSTASAQIEAQESAELEFAPSSEYRHFFERLRRACIECGLSIPDMAHEVGLGLPFAHEFENLTTPLPFSHLSL